MIYAGIKRETLYPEDYIRELLAYQCMPTLLKVKPASLITIDKRLVADIEELYSLLRIYLDHYTCRFIALQETASRIYLFLYSEHQLWQSMTVGKRQSFLESYGYTVQMEQISGSLTQLGNRYRNYWISGDFPHEIGIFLGYPLADVEGFIRNRGRNYILCGMWKVYHRVKVAESAFLCFHQMKSQAVEIAETKRELLPLCMEEIQVNHQIAWELLSY